MPDVTRNEDGTLTVPMSIEDPGGTLGDGMATIGPDHPLFSAWSDWLDRYERAVARQ